ncbi:MAG: hypothetical protein ACLU4N_27720 [Butyricimonas faecihominis]
MDSRKRPVSWMVVPANKEADSASALFGVAHHLTADGVLLEREKIWRKREKGCCLSQRWRRTIRKVR